jgi:hypothetical protein
MKTPMRFALPEGREGDTELEAALDALEEQFMRILAIVNENNVIVAEAASAYARKDSL